MTTTESRIPTTEDRTWRVLPTLARALLAGALAGAGLGLLTVLVILGAGDPVELQVLLEATFVYGAFAGLVGGAVGIACALTSSVVVLLLHGIHPFGLGAARMVGAVAAAVPPLILATDWTAIGLVGAGLAALSAAALMRWVLGLPPASATMGA